MRLHGYATTGTALREGTSGLLYDPARRDVGDVAPAARAPDLTVLLLLAPRV